ncbi:MAG: hypothetical protein K6E16_04355 [Lachnospiraceae bacterium]|nr:hypothetical protein [Lachnospiraceae bacterium]
MFRMKDQTEIRKRRKIFTAFCLAILLGVLPAATVWASNIALTSLAKGQTLTDQDVIYGSGRLRVTYKDDSGVIKSNGADLDDVNYQVNSVGTHDSWLITSFVYGAPSTLTLYAPGGAAMDENGDEEGIEDDRSVYNPNAIAASFYNKNGQLDYRAKFGKADQGPAGQAAFMANCPKGWTQAFSFSMSYEDKNTFDLKDGKLNLCIPGQLQKTGRKYAVMALDKNGNVLIYQNQSVYPFIFSSDIAIEGYAFELIWQD